MNKHWFQYKPGFSIGDQAPSGTCREIGEFSPRHCITGAGDETPSDAEALENVTLAAHAPDLLRSLNRLFDCPDLNLDELEVETVDALREAKALLDLLDPDEGHPIGDKAPNDFRNLNPYKGKPDPEPINMFIFMDGGLINNIVDRDGKDIQHKTWTIDYDALENGACPVCDNDLEDSPYCPVCGFDTHKKSDEEAIQAALKMDALNVKNADEHDPEPVHQATTLDALKLAAEALEEWHDETTLPFIMEAIDRATQDDPALTLLQEAAQEVINHWDHGDLAASVRQLSEALEATK